MNAIVKQKPLKGMPTKFDYKDLSSEDHLYVKQMEKEIRTLLGSRDKHVFRIGEILTAIKRRLPYGLFTPWIEIELRISGNAARRYMKISKKFGDKSSRLAHLPYCVLYELTMPSISQSLIDSVLAGEYIPSEKELRAINIGQKQQEQEPIMIHSEQAKPRETTIQNLADQLAQIQQQISALPPEIQIKEVEKYVTPPEMQEEMAMLRKEVEKYYTSWEKVTEENKQLTRDRNGIEEGARAIMEQYAVLVEEHEKIAKERDVLLENWNAVSKKNKELSTKLDFLTSSVNRFIGDFSQICDANTIIIDSVLEGTDQCQ